MVSISFILATGLSLFPNLFTLRYPFPCWNNIWPERLFAHMRPAMTPVDNSNTKAVSEQYSYGSLPFVLSVPLTAQRKHPWYFVCTKKESRRVCWSFIGLKSELNLRVKERNHGLYIPLIGIKKRREKYNREPSSWYPRAPQPPHFYCLRLRRILIRTSL